MKKAKMTFNVEIEFATPNGNLSRSEKEELLEKMRNLIGFSGLVLNEHWDEKYQEENEDPLMFYVDEK